MTKIVIDTKGADKDPAVIISGALMALEKYENLSVVLAGDMQTIMSECERLSVPMDRVEILDAPREITNSDSPADAIFNKTESSMLKGLKSLSEREDLFGMVTLGNTGVLLTGAMRHLSGKDRVRPALAAVLPAANGKSK